MFGALALSVVELCILVCFNHILSVSCSRPSTLCTSVAGTFSSPHPQVSRPDPTSANPRNIGEWGERRGIWDGNGAGTGGENGTGAGKKARTRSPHGWP